MSSILNNITSTRFQKRNGGVHKHNQLKYNRKQDIQISQFGIKRVFDVMFIHHMNDDVIGGVVFIIERLLT